MQHSRYSYPPSDYSGSSPPPSGYEQTSGPRQYYPPSNVRVDNQYYPPIAPAPSSSDRYPRTGHYPSRPPAAEYSNPSYPYTAQPDNRGGYRPNEPPYSYNPSAPRAITPPNAPPVSYHRHSSTVQPTPRQFIPTPSEAYANPSRPPRPASAMHSQSRPGTNPYSTSPHTSAGSSSRPHYPGSSSSRPKTSMNSPPAVSPTSGERFVCEVCRKDFSRAHDRKRHHETQHAATPVAHKCIYCGKDFSRADSLKRHIQNGCDEAPPQ
ncbi:hypothetical protein B0H11DRAFT_2246263 [Mycena galericulata]|nr:hypothetical protein B0H11DRAFT_2246263 [Mycena galericulata]